MMRDALKGLTVLDFTQIAAGPVCTMSLADMGARVIKIEPPEGELGRGLGPAWVGDDSALYHGFNRGKQGLCLDLKHPDSREIVERLVREADVLIESMRPGVMARLGLGYEAMAQFNPALVYCSISAYGQQGPYAQRAGVDGILQADSGLMGLIGVPEQPPCKVQAPVVDVVTGYMACMAILAKLHARAQDGQGGHLDVSLMNSALALQQSSINSYLRDARLPMPIGSAAPYAAPNEAFSTADGWVMVAAYNGNRWPRLCQVLKRPELADDPRFASSALRVANRVQMQAELNACFLTRNSADWLPLLEAADILCAKVADYHDLQQHPQVRANGMFATIEHPDYGALRVVGFPVNSAESATRPYTPAPSLGEHNQQVLAELGFDAECIDAWRAAGVLRQA